MGPSTPTNVSAKKTFFNISPTNTFSSFMNKNKANKDISTSSASENEVDEKNNVNSSSTPKGPSVPKTIAPKPNHLKIINDEETETETTETTQSDENENEK